MVMRGLPHRLIGVSCGRPQTVKVGDLGLGRLLSDKTVEAHSKGAFGDLFGALFRCEVCSNLILPRRPPPSAVGTPLYMSPEVLRGGGYEWSSDVWSLGCILFELAMLRSPFKEDGLNIYGLFQKITAGVYPPVSDVYSPSLRDLVRRMLLQSPSERPTIDEVCAIAEHMRDETARMRLAALAAAAALAEAPPPVRGSGGPERADSDAAAATTALPVAPQGVESAVRDEPAPPAAVPFLRSAVTQARGVDAPPAAPALLPSERDDASGDEQDAAAAPGAPAAFFGAAAVDSEFGRALQAFRNAEASASVAPPVAAPKSPLHIAATGLHVSSPAMAPKSPLHLAAAGLHASAALPPRPADRPLSTRSRIGSGAPSAVAGAVASVSHVVKAGPLPLARNATAAAHAPGSAPAPEAAPSHRSLRTYSVESMAPAPEEESPRAEDARSSTRPHGGGGGGEIDLVEVSPVLANSALVDDLLVLGAFDSATEDSIDALPRSLASRTLFALATPPTDHFRSDYGSGSFAQFVAFLHVGTWLAARLSPGIAGPRCADLFNRVRTGATAPPAAAASFVAICEADLCCPRDILGANAAELAVTVTRGLGAPVLRLLLWLANQGVSQMGPLSAPPRSYQETEPDCVIYEEEGDDGFIAGCEDELPQSRRALWNYATADALGCTSEDDGVFKERGASQRETSFARKPPEATSPRVASMTDSALDVGNAPVPDEAAWRAETERVRARLAAADRRIRQQHIVALEELQDRSALAGNISSLAAAHERPWRGHIALLTLHAGVLRSAESMRSCGDSILDTLGGLANTCQTHRDVIDRAERRWNDPRHFANAGGAGSRESLADLITQRNEASVAVNAGRLRTAALEFSTTSLSLRLDSLRELCDEAAVRVEERVAGLSGASKLNGIKAALVALRRDNNSLLIQLGVLQQRRGRQMLDEASKREERQRRGRGDTGMLQASLSPGAIESGNRYVPRDEGET